MSYGPRRGTSFALVVGYLALAVGIIVAHQHPATGYEPSIYAATPLAFWAGVGLAVLAATVVGVNAANAVSRWLATLLGGFVAVAVVGLPLVRGYTFYASADTLSHLGWIRDLAAGRLTPFDLLYPADHASSLMIAELTGYGLPRAVMLFVVVVFVGFFVAVTLAVWALTSSEVAAAVGAFSAFMFLPINVAVTEPVLHPISQASLYLAVVLYVAARYMTSQPGGGLPVTAIGAVFALVSASLVLYHPQAALGMVVLLGTIAVAQFLARRVREGSALAATRPVYGQAVFLAVVFAVWSVQHEAIFNTADLAVRTIAAFVTGSVPVGGTVQQRGASLSAIGSGLHEILLKLFLVSGVFVALSGLVVLASLSGRLDRFDAETRGVVEAFGFGLASLVAVLAVHLLGRLTVLMLRYVSMIMAVATVLGAVALYWLFRPSPGDDAPYSKPAGTVLSVALVLMLGLSLLAVFPSPYVYLPSEHVSEMDYEGHAVAFNQTDENATFRGLRQAEFRYRHAILGTTNHEWRSPSVSPTVVRTNLTQELGDDYLVITTKAERRETDVFRGLRYTDEDFRRMESYPDLNRVQSNGEFVLYHPANGTDATGSRLPD